jgi:hypothetical protein
MIICYLHIIRLIFNPFKTDTVLIGNPVWTGFAILILLRPMVPLSHPGLHGFLQPILNLLDHIESPYQ